MINAYRLLSYLSCLELPTLQGRIKDFSLRGRNSLIDFQAVSLKTVAVFNKYAKLFIIHCIYIFSMKPRCTFKMFLIILLLASEASRFFLGAS